MISAGRILRQGKVSLLLTELNSKWGVMLHQSCMNMSFCAEREIDRHRQTDKETESAVCSVWLGDMYMYNLEFGTG